MTAKHTFAAAAIVCGASLLQSCTGTSGRTGTDSSADSTMTLLVGSYSSPTDSALCAYRFNPADGTAERLYAMPVANASFAAVTGRDVLAVTEGGAAESRLTALRLVPDGSSATLLGSVPVDAEAPCYVTVSPDGRFAVTANYGDGSVAVFPILENGAPGPRRQLVRFEGRGPVEGRQDSPHAHCVAFTPDSRFMLVTDLGTDRIHGFRVVEGADSLIASRPDFEVMLEPESGPRHIIFDRSGSHAYLINEISDKVTVLDYADGRLTPVQYIEADTAQAHGAGDIHLTPDGRHLFASLRLKHEGIATFAVDSVSGRLTHIAHTPTGGHPRNFTITPDGRFMLVACRDADAVEVYAIDPATAALTRRATIPQPKAVFVKLL